MKLNLCAPTPPTSSSPPPRPPQPTYCQHESMVFSAPAILVLDENGAPIDSTKGRVDGSHPSPPQSESDYQPPGSDPSSASSTPRNSFLRPTRISLTSEAKKLTNKANELIVQVPVKHFRRIANNKGISSLSRETQHFVGITTINGMLRIYRSRGPYRLFWLGVTLFCVCMLLGQVGVLLQIYAGRPTLSQVSFIMPEQGLSFPAVTICSYNPIKKSYVERLNATGHFSRRLLDYISQSFMDVQFLISVTNPLDLEKGEEELRDFTMNYTNYTFHSAESSLFNIVDFFWNASLSCREMLKICSFGGREFNCCEYARGILTDIGKCYQLDLSYDADKEGGQSDEESGGELWMRRQMQAGVNNGLQIIADFHTEQQMEGLDMEAGPPFSNEFETGFRYYVHERHTMPYLATEGISVSPGTKVYSAISPTNYILLPPEEWGNCTAEWEQPPVPALPDYNELTSATVKTDLYSSMKCKTLCRAAFFHEHCGCAPYIYNVEGQYRVCSPYEIYKCLNDTVMVGVDVESAEDYFKALPSCSECKIECHRWVYHTYNSYAQGFSRGSMAYLQKRNTEWSPLHVRSNFVAMNIFYRDMCYTEYRQVRSMSVTEILSDIGGNMGLFLGMSLISFTEFLIYITKISWIFISRKRREHMMAKKHGEEERERRLQATLEAAATAAATERHGRRGSDAAFSERNASLAENFGQRLKRLASGSMRRSREKKISQSDLFNVDVPSSPTPPQETSCSRTLLTLPDTKSDFKKYVTRRSSAPLNALNRKISPPAVKSRHKRVDFIDTLLENRLHGEHGRASYTRQCAEGEVSDGESDASCDDLVELRLPLATLHRDAECPITLQHCSIATGEVSSPTKFMAATRIGPVGALSPDKRRASSMAVGYTSNRPTISIAEQRLQRQRAKTVAPDTPQSLDVTGLQQQTPQLERNEGNQSRPITTSLFIRSLKPFVFAQAKLAMENP